MEEGRLSDGWRSPLQRKLAADADGLVSGSDVGGNGTRGTKRNLASVGYDRDAPETDELERFARGPEDRWRRDRGLKSENAPEGQESCPLIYTVDAKTAKKHGLILFQVSLLVPLHVYSCPITSCSQLDGVRARVCRMVLVVTLVRGWCSPLALDWWCARNNSSSFSSLHNTPVYPELRADARLVTTLHGTPPYEVGGCGKPRAPSYPSYLLTWL